MIVVFRRFRSRAGEEERVLDALRKHAATMLRDRRAEAVMVCQRADIPQCLLWMQHHPGGVIPPVAGEESPSLFPSGLIEAHGVPVPAEFVDGTYRFPLPACRVWVAETSDDATARALLAISQRAASDRRVCGVSIYRTMEQCSRMMAFFALVPEVSPDGYFASGRDGIHGPRASFHPLRASWTVGRLTPGTPAVAPIVQYPQSFSARMGLVLPPDAGALRTEPVTAMRQ